MNSKSFKFQHFKINQTINQDKDSTLHSYMNNNVTYFFPFWIADVIIVFLRALSQPQENKVFLIDKRVFSNSMFTRGDVGGFKKFTS